VWVSDAVSGRRARIAGFCQFGKSLRPASDLISLVKRLLPVGCAHPVQRWPPCPGGNRSDRHVRAIADIFNPSGTGGFVQYPQHGQLAMVAAVPVVDCEIRHIELIKFNLHKPEFLGLCQLLCRLEFLSSIRGDTANTISTCLSKYL
jgi:hypothetical protein